MTETVVMVEIKKETPVAFKPSSLDTDLATTVRQPQSELRKAIGEVSGTAGDSAVAVPDSEATTIAALVADHNALLAALRAVGVVAAE